MNTARKPPRALVEKITKDGLMILQCRQGSTKSMHRRFNASFGLVPSTIAAAWQLLVQSKWLDKAGTKAQTKHLLWALLFLKLYQSENSLASFVGADEKTVRKWLWFYATGISRLHENVVRSHCVGKCRDVDRCLGSRYSHNLTDRVEESVYWRYITEMFGDSGWH